MNQEQIHLSLSSSLLLNSFQFVLIVFLVYSYAPTRTTTYSDLFLFTGRVRRKKGIGKSEKGIGFSILVDSFSLTIIFGRREERSVQEGCTNTE
jgi:hypothetical protein